MFFLFMQEIKILIGFIIIIISGNILSKIFVTKKYLLNYNGSLHQKFTKNKLVPLIGGILFLTSLFFIDFTFNSFFLIFAIIFFLLGFLSDAGYLSSAKARFIIQFLILLYFLLLSDLTIPHIRFFLIDKLLEFKFFSYFFTIICFMILINGTNFIDGCNTLVIGYFSIIGIILFKLNLLNLVLVENESQLIFFSYLFAIFILNFFQKLFLGDSGVYILSFIFGSILIKLYIENPLISPYFICNLLWYPSFEVLFSIIRKYNFKFSALKPDTNHLHQLLYFYLLKKNKKIDSVLINSLAANIINFYNLCILFIASHDFSNSKFQLLLLMFSVIIYCLMYSGLYKFRFKNL